MVPAENGIDTKSKPTLPSSSSTMPNTNNKTNTGPLIDAIHKSVKLKQQLCSVNVQSSFNTTSNSAPHPISSDYRHKVHHSNMTVVTFVHPPPEPMPSQLIVTISRHCVKLKDEQANIPSFPCIHVSSDESADNTHVTYANSCSDTLFDAHFMDTSSSYNNIVSDKNLDELLGIKSEPSTGKVTPVDEVISTNAYLLDMNMDYNSFMSTIAEDDHIFNSEGLPKSDSNKVEGVDGFFSCRGTWCDWTQAIPSRDEDSVVVLPYVYID